MSLGALAGAGFLHLVARPETVDSDVRVRSYNPQQYCVLSSLPPAPSLTSPFGWFTGRIYGIGRPPYTRNEMSALLPPVTQAVRRGVARRRVT